MMTPDPIRGEQLRADVHDFLAVVERAKREIRADVAAGRVPATVAGFAELHDHVDANGYGGAFELWAEGDADSDAACAFWNRVQGDLDRWIKDGMK